MMKICTSPREMQVACRTLRMKSPGMELGLVPTMGALHAGHLSLVAMARAECDAVAASIFVNPLQFSPGEDFERYPRNFEQDCHSLETDGVELLFAPLASEFVRPDATTFVEVAGVGERLDGASRPGHFRGVATIVAKLFNAVGPDRAYFGQKDAAQVAVLKAMVRDLNFPVDLIICPTIREEDGLAMSSRNRYLSAEERGRAAILRRALRVVEERVDRGETSAAALREAMLRALATDLLLRVDYAEIVDPESLLPVDDISGGALVAVAAWIGGTRLIDNVLIQTTANVVVQASAAEAHVHG